MEQVKTLKWFNGQEWGECFHPDLGWVMTYCEKGRPCYDSYTKPFIDDDGDICCYRFDQDEGYWVEEILFLKEWEGEEEIGFPM